MTKFYIEDIFIEELKEQNLNAIDLLQTHAKKQKKQQVVIFDIGDETIEELKRIGIINIEQEIIDAIQKNANEHGETIEIIRKKKQC